METTYIVLLWGIAGSEVTGPFADRESASGWIDDYSFEDSDFDGGMIVGPLSCETIRNP